MCSENRELSGVTVRFNFPFQLQSHWKRSIETQFLNSREKRVCSCPVLLRFPKGHFRSFPSHSLCRPHVFKSARINSAACHKQCRLLLGARRWVRQRG